MNTRRKFNQDFDVAFASITDVMDCLTKKMPTEMVALVFLQNLKGLLEDLTDFDQWELLKGDLVDIRNEFENEVEPHLSNLIDPDLEEENYNKRYA
jgi:hypothetical protein